MKRRTLLASLLGLAVAPAAAKAAPIMPRRYIVGENANDAACFMPTSNDGIALGSSAVVWGDMFLADGTVFRFPMDVVRVSSTIVGSTVAPL